MKFLKTHYGRAINVIPSDTVNIPNPAGLGSTGTATATEAGKLVDDNASFTTNLIGAIVVNTTDDTVANVLNVENGTALVLSADIMADTESYAIYNSDNNQGCALYIAAQEPGLLKVLTVGGDTVEFLQCGDTNASMILPINVLRVFETDTSLVKLVALW
jgi:hypothetical protein